MNKVRKRHGIYAGLIDGVGKQRQIMPENGHTENKNGIQCRGMDIRKIKPAYNAGLINEDQNDHPIAL